MQPITLLIPLTIATYVAFDSHRLGARRGRLGGGIYDRGPAVWFLVMALTGIIGIYLYTKARPLLVEANNREAGPGPIRPQSQPRPTHEQQRPFEKIIYPPQY